MSNFSLNDVPVGITPKEENTVSEIKPVEQEAPVSQPKMYFDNIETYKHAVASMREELVKLMQEGHMAEQVAEKLLTDFMHTSFNQIVKLRFE